MSCAMPKDLPPSSICHDYWRLLSDGGHMEQINHRLEMMDTYRSHHAGWSISHPQAVR